MKSVFKPGDVLIIVLSLIGFSLWITAVQKIWIVLMGISLLCSGLIIGCRCQEYFSTEEKQKNREGNTSRNQKMIDSKSTECYHMNFMW